MDKSLRNLILALVIVFAIILLLVWIGGNVMGIEALKTGENPVLRFVFVIIGMAIVFGVYYATRSHAMWTVGTREVVYMAIGAALYAVLAYLFNGTVFAVPSVSQVALRPAISIPMFFGFAFGPVVGFFTGAVGNTFGDALTGFGLYPQWSVGNGLVGFIAGLVFLFKDRKKSLDAVLIVSAVIAALLTALFLLNRDTPNTLFYDVENNIFGDAPITQFAGFSALIGFVLVLAIRFGFRNNLDVAAAVTWGALGNFLGIGFAAISDIWINKYSLVVAVVGEFLPAAGPNMIFAAILVPLLVLAYASVQRQSGR
jgi:uncharacterized membrane protein